MLHHTSTSSKDGTNPRMERLGRIGAIFTLAVVLPAVAAVGAVIYNKQQDALKTVPEVDRAGVQAVATRGGAKCESLREDLRPACEKLKNMLAL